MKLTAKRSELASATTVAARASFSASMAAVGGMLMQPAAQTVLLTCTDGWTTARVRQTVHASEAGAALVPAKRIADTLRFLDGDDVELEIKGDRLSISCGLFDGSLPLMPVGNFPSLQMPEGRTVKVPGSPLASAIMKVAPATSRDDSRVMMQGIRLEAKNGFLYVIATDGVRIAAQKLEIPDKELAFEAVLQKDSLTDVARSATGEDEVELIVDDETGEVTLSLPNLSITSRPVTGGSYPEWRKYVPSADQDYIVSVDRRELTAALHRMTPMTDDSTPVRFEIGESGIGLQTKSQFGEAHDVVSYRAASRSWDTAFNPALLLQGLDVLEGDVVKISQDGELKPASFHGQDGQFMYIQMPVRVVGR
jgi:DNA polymerase-3 subunit beta